jgi:hypothetical protein
MERADAARDQEGEPRGGGRDCACARALLAGELGGGVGGRQFTAHALWARREQTARVRWSRVLPLAAAAGVAAHDLLQRRHALLRNFPVLGHGRYLLEAIGPELRQYIIAGNDE